MLKAAVIGTGSIGRHHVRNYHEIPTVELVGVSDLNAEQAERVATSFGNAPHYSDFEQMLDAQKPDLVSICVPTQHHYAVAEAVIKRGIHLLVEKPITETVEQAEKIIQQAQDAGLVLTVGHIERFNPAVIELKKHLEEDRLGKVFRVQARRMGPFPARIRDVGVVIDLATHDLDMIRYVLGDEIVRLYAETAQGINTDREDIMDCVLRTAGGVIGTLNINWMTATKIRELSIIGARGMYTVNYLTQDLYFYENDVIDDRWDTLGVLTGVGEGNVTKFRLTRREPLRAELEAFAQAVEDNSTPLVNGHDGLQALLLAKSLVQSGIDGNVVTF